MSPRLQPRARCVYPQCPRSSRGFPGSDLAPPPKSWEADRHTRRRAPAAANLSERHSTSVCHVTGKEMRSAQNTARKGGRPSSLTFFSVDPRAFSHKRNRVESQDQKRWTAPCKKKIPLRNPISQKVEVLISKEGTAKPSCVLVIPKRCPNHQKIGRLALIPLVAEHPCSKQIARLRGKESPANNAQRCAQSPKMLRLQRGCPEDEPLE